MKDQNLQIENWDFYVKAINWYVDEMMLKLTKAEGSALLLIIRKTLGWGKKQDAISYSQFMKFCDLSCDGVTRAIQKLEKMNIIKIIRPGNRKINIYEFNTTLVSSVAVAKTTPLSGVPKSKLHCSPVYTAEQGTPLSSCTSNKNSLNSSLNSLTCVNVLPEKILPAKQGEAPRRETKKAESEKTEKAEISNSSEIEKSEKEKAKKRKREEIKMKLQKIDREAKENKSKASESFKAILPEKEKTEIFSTSSEGSNGVPENNPEVPEAKTKEREVYSTLDEYNPSSVSKYNKEKYFSNGFEPPDSEKSRGTKFRERRQKKLDNGKEIDCNEAASIFKEQYIALGLGSYDLDSNHRKKLKELLLRRGTVEVLKIIEYYLKNFEEIHKDNGINATKPEINIMIGYLNKFLSEALEEKIVKKKGDPGNANVPAEFRSVVTWEGLTEEEGRVK